MPPRDRGDNAGHKTQSEFRVASQRMPGICVHCGSNMGSRPIYREAAGELADVLVRQDFELVFGGADKGIMGVISDAVLQRGGKVYGVIPKMLCEKELAHQKLTELHVVASMHARKTMMVALADGFIDLPGGYATLAYLDQSVVEGFLKVEKWAH